MSTGPGIWDARRLEGAAGDSTGIRRREIRLSVVARSGIEFFRDLAKNAASRRGPGWPLARPEGPAKGGA